MAKISFKNQEDFLFDFWKLSSAFTKDEILERATAAGAKIVADEIRRRLEGLPVTKFRHLKDGEKRRGLTEIEMEDLSGSFGLAPIRNEIGYINTKAGLDGYGSRPTKTYPNGVPNAMVARAVESGSSMRMKTPFVRPAVRAVKKEAIEAMQKVIDDEVKKYLGG